MKCLRRKLKKVIPERHHSGAQLIYFSLRGLLFLGNRFVCPCCNGHFRRFLPFGVKPKPIRPNAQCPRCGSFERYRLLWLYLKDRTNFFKDNLKVLDVGPVPIFQRKCKALPNIDYVSGDISSTFAMVKMNITDIPVPDNQFDCIICYSVLQYIHDDQKAMKELFRVLKPGGWAILHSPVDLNREKTFEDPDIVTPQERERVFGHRDHVRIYGRDYEDRLEMAGFTVKLDDYVGKLDDDVIKKFGLMEQEIIYFCTKPKNT